MECTPARPAALASMRAHDNSSSCLPCQPGTFAAEIASHVCLPCPVNSLQPIAQSSSCVPCTDAYARHTGEGRANGTCLDCPEGAECSQTGNITAHGGYFLVIDEASDTVRSFPCSISACVDALGDGVDPLSLQPPQRIPSSAILVHNRCAEGRYPAYTPDWQQLGIDALRPTAGVNLLCALCLPGYSQIDGVCVRCESVNGGLMLVLLVMITVLVLSLHRWPHNKEGKATLTVVGYFLQQSALFLAPSFYLMALLNLDVSGDSVTQSARGVGARGFGLTQCLWPTHDDAERVFLSLALLMVVFIMPALVATVQALYYLLLCAWKQPPPFAFRLYSLAFMAAPPAPLQRPGRPTEVPVGSPHPSPVVALRKPLAPAGVIDGDEVSALAEPLCPREPASPSLRKRSKFEPVWLVYQRTVVRVL